MTVPQSTPIPAESSNFFQKMGDRIRNSSELSLAKFGLITTLGFGTLTACATTPESTPKPVETSYTGEVTETPEATPELVTNYKALNWSEYNPMPQQDRLKYVDYRLENNIDSHKAALAGKEKPAFVALTAESTPQEIVDQFVYILDEAHLQYEIKPDSSNKLVDANEGIKLLSGAFLNVEGNGLSAIYDNEKKRLIEEAEKGNGPFADDTKLTATGSELKTEEVDGQQVTSQLISFYTDEGNEFTGRWVKVDYTSIAGEPKVTWLLDQTYEANQALAEN